VGIQGRIVHKLPKWIRMTPMDVMFAFLGTLSASTSLIGLSQPSSLTRILPWWGPMLWSLCLLIGCLAWLSGLSSVKENNGHMVLTRMPALIFGLYLVSLSSFTYGVILLVIAGTGGLVAATTFFAVAAGTYLRRVDFASRYRGDE
jgi:hypothetical protein